jgi:hypothetical protein
VLQLCLKWCNIAFQGWGVDRYPDILGSLTNCSFAIWANFANSGGTWQRIWELTRDTGANVMFLTPRYGTTGTMRFGINSGGGSEQLVDAPTTLPSGWHHVTVTIEQVTSAHSMISVSTTRYSRRPRSRPPWRNSRSPWVPSPMTRRRTYFGMPPP